MCTQKIQKSKYTHTIKVSSFTIRLSCSESFHATKTSLEVQPGFVRKQHLHVVARSTRQQAPSIEKLPVDAFVSAATADARSMVNLVCLFMKTYLLSLLQITVLNSSLSACVRNTTAFFQHLLRPIKLAVLADADISVKPKYRPIYRSISS